MKWNVHSDANRWGISTFIKTIASIFTVVLRISVCNVWPWFSTKSRKPWSQGIGGCNFLITCYDSNTMPLCVRVPKFLRKKIIYMKYKISIRIAQVHPVSFNFQGQTFENLFDLQIAREWREVEETLLFCHQIRSHVFAIDWQYCECCISWRWQTFSGSHNLNC